MLYNEMPRTIGAFFLYCILLNQLFVFYLTKRQSEQLISVNYEK